MSLSSAVWYGHRFIAGALIAVLLWYGEPAAAAEPGRDQALRARPTLRPISPYAKVDVAPGMGVDGIIVGTLPSDNEAEDWLGHNEPGVPSPFSGNEVVARFHKKVAATGFREKYVLRQFVINESRPPEQSLASTVKFNPAPLFFETRYVTHKPIGPEPSHWRAFFIAAAFPESVKEVDLLFGYPTEWYPLSDPPDPNSNVRFPQIPIATMRHGTDVYASVPGNCDHDCVRMIARGEDGTVHHPEGLFVKRTLFGNPRTVFVFAGLTTGRYRSFHLQGVALFWPDFTHVSLYKDHKPVRDSNSERAFPPYFDWEAAGARSRTAEEWQALLYWKFISGLIYLLPDEPSDDGAFAEMNADQDGLAEPAKTSVGGTGAVTDTPAKAENALILKAEATPASATPHGTVAAISHALAQSALKLVAGIRSNAVRQARGIWVQIVSVSSEFVKRPVTVHVPAGWHW